MGVGGEWGSRKWEELLCCGLEVCYDSYSPFGCGVRRWRVGG